MKSFVYGGLSALVLAGGGSLFGPLCAEAGAQVFSSQRSPQTQTQSQSQFPSQPGAPVPRNSQRTRPEPLQSSTTVQAALAQDETLYLNKGNTYSYNLIVRNEAILGGQRLPTGAVVRGQFEPAEGGLVYKANSVEVGDRIYQVNAVSELLRDRKDPRQKTTGAIVTDAAIGAAGGYVLGEVLGNANVWEVVGGAAAGVLVGNTTAPSVVVVKPEDQIVLYSN
ncbi:MAG: hypothetical protein WBA76_05890 [Phormidesmis sp.]